MPLRIQRKRAKGWRKPRGVIDCGRPGPWGNPFVVLHDTSGWWAMTDRNNGHWFGHDGERKARSMAVTLFRECAVADTEEIRAQLAGHNLMCWCQLCPAHAEGKPAGITCDDCAPCHCDVLLEIANGQ